MIKVCIYYVDQLPGGEVGIIEFLSQKGYHERDSIIYDKNSVVRGRLKDGTHFSEETLELHVFGDPNLEKIIDKHIADNLS